jgi:endonuclease/exonuclease/phosphatase family metal-dependent hydrolase
MSPTVLCIEDLLRRGQSKSMASRDRRDLARLAHRAALSLAFGIPGSKLDAPISGSCLRAKHGEAPMLRILSYNIQHALGGDGRVDLPRIADVIAATAADVVALQEVDVHRPRSGSIDQAHELAERLGMRAEFTACIEGGGEFYGLATLSGLPIESSRSIALPALPQHRRSRPRRALITRLVWDDRPLDVINTHFSVVGAERPAQAAAILREVGLGDCVVCGDFNCVPRSGPFQHLSRVVKPVTGGARTWPARAPLFAIDHILIRGALTLVEGGRWLTPPARAASDHLPVLAVVGRS